MKSVLMAITFLAASLSMATDYVPVPEGHYSGQGTWADNFGVEGTLEANVHVYRDENGLHNDFTATFSDGRTYAGATLVVFGDNSTFTYLANFGGQLYPVGTGVSTPNSYQIHQLALNNNEVFSEFGNYLDGVWTRAGSIVDDANDRTTVIHIKQYRR